MAVYAIGDIHGCWQALRELLHQIGFLPGRDRLWFVGDLISRGPESLEVIKFVQDQGDRAITLMGNHEMRAVGVLSGAIEPSRRFPDPLLEAPNREELLIWLRQLPLFHWDRELGFAMVHAGIMPEWSLLEAELRAMAVANTIQDPELSYLLLRLQPVPEVAPPLAEDPLMALRHDLAVFTSMRLCRADGRLLWPSQAVAMGLANGYMMPPADFPYQPWFNFRPREESERLLYGHWAAVGFNIRHHQGRIHSIGLDSGCVYGGQLTAIRLDKNQGEDDPLPVWQVACPRHMVQDEEVEGEVARPCHKNKS